MSTMPVARMVSAVVAWMVMVFCSASSSMKSPVLRFLSRSFFAPWLGGVEQERHGLARAEVAHEATNGRNGLLLESAVYDGIKGELELQFYPLGISRLAAESAMVGQANAEAA